MNILSDYVKKFQYRYDILPLEVKAVFWYTICGILQKGITLIATPIFTRLMSTAQYGVFTIYQSWYSILQIFVTLNLASGVINNGIVKFKDQNRFLLSSQSLSSSVTIFFLVIYVLGIKFWNSVFDLPTHLVILMFIQLLFEPSFNYWSLEQRYKYRYKTLVILNLGMSFFSVILGVVAVMSLSQKADARIFSFALITIFVGVFFYIYICKKANKIFDTKYWKYCLKINLPLIPHFLASSILNQSDRIMIAKMIGAKEAAIYSIAYSISMMMTIIINAVNNSFVPYVYDSLEKDNLRNLKKVSNFLLILIGAFCLFAIGIGPELLKIFAAKQYFSAVWVMPPVALSVYFLFMYTLFCNVETFYEKTKYMMIVSSISALFNIVLNYIFIKLFGFIAAGYTTLLCYIIFAVSHYIIVYLIDKDKCRKMFSGLKMIGLSLILLLLMLLFTISYKFTLIRYGLILGVLLIIYINRAKVKENINIFR